MDMVLSVENAEKYYGREPNLKKALDRVDFEVSAGEFVSIMGPSGSGKTTLLNCISTIDTIDAGHIYLGSQDLASLPQQKSARFRQENLDSFFRILICWIPSALRKTLHCRWQSRIFRRKR